MKVSLDQQRTSVCVCFRQQFVLWNMNACLPPPPRGLKPVRAANMPLDVSLVRKSRLSRSLRPHCDNLSMQLVPSKLLSAFVIATFTFNSSSRPLPGQQRSRLSARGGDTISSKKLSSLSVLVRPFSVNATESSVAISLQGSYTPYPQELYEAQRLRKVLLLTFIGFFRRTDASRRGKSIS